MNKVEQIIEQIKNKKIQIEDLFNLALDEQEFDTVVKALKKSGIDIEENFEESKLDVETNYNNDIVKQYLEEIGKIPILSKEEETKLFLEYSTTNDAKIREKIINSNLKLVVNIAKRYYHKIKINTVGFLDLIQDGNKGLIKAVDKYDVTLGYKFSTYASWWIRQGITRALHSKYKMIRRPAHIETFISKMIKYINEESVKTGQSPSVEKISCHFDLSTEKVTDALEIIYNTPISLEDKISGENDITVSDYVKDENVNIEKDYIEKEIYGDLRETIRDVLTPKEYAIISLRFGIINEINKNDSPMTLEQIAVKFGITRERIRQIEAKALRKLRTVEQGNKIKSLRNS